MPKQISLLYLVSIAALTISSELIMAIHFWSNHNWLSAILLISVSVPFAPFVMPFTAWAYWDSFFVNALYFSTFSLIGSGALAFVSLSYRKGQLSRAKSFLINIAIVAGVILAFQYWLSGRTMEACQLAVAEKIGKKSPYAIQELYYECYLQFGNK